MEEPRVDEVVARGVDMVTLGSLPQTFGSRWWSQSLFRRADVAGSRMITFCRYLEEFQLESGRFELEFNWVGLKLDLFMLRPLRKTAALQEYLEHEYCHSSASEGLSKWCRQGARVAARLGERERGSGSINPSREGKCRDSASVASACSRYRGCRQCIRIHIVESDTSIYLEQTYLLWHKSLLRLPLRPVQEVRRTWTRKRRTRERATVLKCLAIEPKQTKRRRATVCKYSAIELKPLVITPEHEADGEPWKSLPADIQDMVLQKLEYEDLFRFKAVSKSSKELVERDVFLKARTTPESSFTALHYYIKDNAWRCIGYDLVSKAWRRLPPFSPTLPAPDKELFKAFIACGHGGLMCADVAKVPRQGNLVVFAPLTMATFPLPPLLSPRSPVLVHLVVDSEAESYRVIVAGSSTAGDEHLSKKTEVFDSRTSRWEQAPDLPGPAFGLNEHQAGVCIAGVLYLVAFLEGDCRRGVIAFDVEKKKWLGRTYPIPFSMSSNTLQLCATGDKVHLFSEQERGGSVEHCIDVLEKSAEGHYWRNVVRAKKPGGRGLQVYPEYTCVSFGEGKLCVFNTLSCDGVVYDMRDGTQVETVQPPPAGQKGESFFTLNPALFTLQPTFGSNPTPQPHPPH